MEENPVLEEMVTVEAEEDSYVQDESNEGSSDLPEVTIEEHARKDVDWNNYLSEYNTGWAESPYEPKDNPHYESTTSTKINLSVPIEKVITAVSIVQGLEPKPGRGYSDDETIYVTPDIYIFKGGDDYEIVQNEDGLPKLRINYAVQSHSY
jgi:hypothetical protein